MISCCLISKPCIALLVFFQLILFYLILFDFIMSDSIHSHFGDNKMHYVGVPRHATSVVEAALKKEYSSTKTCHPYCQPWQEVMSLSTSAWWMEALPVQPESCWGAWSSIGSCEVSFSPSPAPNPGYVPVNALLWRSDSIPSWVCNCRGKGYKRTQDWMWQYKAGQVLNHHHPAGVKQHFLDCPESSPAAEGRILLFHLVLMGSWLHSSHS